MWHPMVTCTRCGRLHECLRLVAEPCAFPMICHGCEAVLSITIGVDQLAQRRHDRFTENKLAVAGYALKMRAS